MSILKGTDLLQKVDCVKTQNKIIYKFSSAVLLSKQFNTQCRINYSAISTYVCLNMIYLLLCPYISCKFTAVLSPHFQFMLVLSCVAKSMKNFQHFSYFGTCYLQGEDTDYIVCQNIGTASTYDAAELQNLKSHIRYRL
jgi:hypothetical protein